MGCTPAGLAGTVVDVTDGDRLLLGLLALIALLIVGPVLAMAAVLPAMGPHGMGDATWHPVWLIVGWVVLLGIVVAIGYLGVRIAREEPTEPEDDALQELRIAYARGDVDDEEYEKRYERLKEE